MINDHDEVADREPDREQRLYEILAAYFEAVEAGRPPDRAEWLARYPERAEEIAAFLDEQDRLLRLTEPLRPTTGEGEASDPEPATGMTGTSPTDGQDPVDGSADYSPGTRVRYIGDYELLDEIARGGMGVVFRARQRSLNRTVAVKMLIAEDYATAADERRFRQEAEAAANLDHPHIVPIFEVGRHDGRSYFSMKLVEGDSLAQRLTDFASDPRASARLVATVARAVHYAHRRGVLHRDLKPGNILLSGGPETPIDRLEPQVTDFGLAKRVEGDPGLTQSGAILGTPSYMAPEQAAGKKGSITIATDVYGLGAVLYALLAGRPPFRGDSVLETIAQVKDVPVEPPSRHGRRIDRDLETICLKCLEKEPGRRYSSAEAVAEDLERWLAGSPIQARPAGRLERAWRWCRRKPAVASLTGAVISLVVLALAMLAISNRTIAGQRDEARLQRRRAEANFRRARDAVDRMLTEVSEKALADIPQAEPLRRTLLEKAAAFYREFLDEQPAEASLRYDTSRAYARLGDVEGELGRSSESVQSYRRQVEFLQELLRETPDRTGYVRDMTWAHFHLAMGFMDAGDLAAAAIESDRAIELAQGLVDRFPGEIGDRKALARSLDVRAGIWLRTGQVDEAGTSFGKAVEVYERLLRDGLAGFPRTEFAGALNNLAVLEATRGQLGPAAALLERAIAQQQQAVKADPKSVAGRSYLRNQYENRAIMLAQLGRPDEALAAASQIIPLGQALMTDYPFRPEYRHDLADSYLNLGNIQRGAGRLRDAEASFRRSIELGQKLVDDSPGVPSYWMDIAQFQLKLGDLLRDTARPAEARDAYLRALEVSDRVAARFPKLPDSRTSPAAPAISLAWLLATSADSRVRDPARAVALARRATGLDPKNGGFWNTLGVAHYRAGEWNDAIAALEKSMELRRGGDPADWFFLAMARWKKGDRNGARRWYEKATDWMRNRRSTDPDLRRFRSEAEDLLGIADSQMPDGPDAFTKE